MTESNWRELCAELTGWIERAIRHYSGLGRVVSDPDVLIRARAALAQPEPEVVADGPAVPEGRELAAVVGELSDKALLNLWASSPHIDEPHGGISFARAAIAAARAALAQPEPEVGPTDEELLGLDELEESWNAQADAANSWDELGIDEIIIWAQRQALARYGHQPAPPAEGDDVGDEARYLVKELRDQADGLSPSIELFGLIHRAADLLEQRHPAPVLEPALARINDILNDSGRIFLTDELEALELARQALEQRQTAQPAPVPLAERLPGPGDCDAEGRCWWWRTDGADEWWELLCISDAREYNAGCGNARYTHWLSYPSFPLPDQE